MKKEIKIGLTVFLALILAYLSLTWAKRSHFFAGEGVIYPIDFQHISGLLVGDPVHIRGYTMGRVESIDPQVDKIVVRISLDRDYPLPEGTLAEIQPKELMGGKQIELVQGMGTTAIQPGTALTGRASLDFSSAFSQVGGMFEQIEGDRMRQFFDKMDSLLSQGILLASSVDAQSIKRIVYLLEDNLRGIQKLQQDWKKRDMIGRIDSTVQILEQTLENADMRMHEIGVLIQSAEGKYLPQAANTLDSLQALIQQLNRLAHKGEEILQQPNTLVDKVIADQGFASQLDTVLGRLNRVLLQIETEKIIVGFKKKKIGKK